MGTSRPGASSMALRTQFYVLLAYSVASPAHGRLTLRASNATALWQRVPDGRPDLPDIPAQRLKADKSSSVYEDQIFAQYCMQLEVEAAETRTQYRLRLATEVEHGSQTDEGPAPEALSKAAKVIGHVAQGIWDHIKFGGRNDASVDATQASDTVSGNGGSSDASVDATQASDSVSGNGGSSDASVNATEASDSVLGNGGSSDASVNATEALDSVSGDGGSDDASVDATQASDSVSGNARQSTAMLAHQCSRLPRAYANKTVNLPMQEHKYLQCPPGPYLNNANPVVKETRRQRLLDAICLAYARGWKANNPREDEHYKSRGYYTFESRLWPKKGVCNKLVDEDWAASTSAMPYVYRPDHAPIHYKKEVCTLPKAGHFEFHKSWKVASTAFPDYLRCEYDCQWREVPVDTPIQYGGAIVAAAVRAPIQRWLSAAGELLDRAINNYCPGGPCDSSDGFVPGTQEGSTVDKLHHSTTWYKLINDDPSGVTAGTLPKLVASMVHDTSCNYFSYAAEHLSTQANFITQNQGGAANISVVIKLEDIDKGLDVLYQSVTKKSQQHQCTFKERNVQSCKPLQENVPSTDELKRVLAHHDELMQDLCLVYAQDFICFDYPLPAACEGMF